MKKKVLLSVLAAGLVLPTANALATETAGFVDTNVPNTVQTTPAIEDQKAKEKTPAPSYVAENNTPGNPGEQEYVTVETKVDTDGDGKVDKIEVKRVPTGVWVNKEGNTPAKKEVKAPVVAKKAPAKKALPKTSAVK